MNARIPAVVLMTMFLTVTSRTQESSPGGIIFSTTHTHVVFLVDGKRFVPSTGDTLVLPPGEHTVERIAGSEFRWSVHRSVDSVLIQPGTFTVVEPTTDSEHLITSEPDGAHVYRDGAKIGSTPLRFRHEGPSEGWVSVAMDGYEDKVITLSRAHEHIILIPESGTRLRPMDAARSIQPVVNNKTWTITSAVAMVASSVAAAYLKEKANRSLEEYQRTGSQAALDDVRRFDLYSGIASTTMQVSFVGFALFLTLE